MLLHIQENIRNTYTLTNGIKENKNVNKTDVLSIHLYVKCN